MTESLTLGALGCAEIARGFVAGLQTSSTERVTHVASRDAVRARAFADEFGVPNWHGSYEALIADPAVEALYVPLPDHLHAPWVMRALMAGKHVLCEKPLALNEAEAFATMVRQGRQDEAMTSLSLDVAATLDAMRLSAERGELVTVAAARPLAG